MDMQVGIFMSKVSEFVSKYGPSTMFSFKLFTEPTTMDLTVIKTGISLYVRTLCDSEGLLCILEEVDEEMANIIQDYRGYILNIILPVRDEDLINKFMGEISYSLNFLKLKHEPMGFKEVEDNV